jgi:triacylglycerol lipase
MTMTRARLSLSDDGGTPAPAWPSWDRPPLLLEARAGLELAALLASPLYAGIGIPRGDGSPVLLIPGFFGSDDYLAVLRGWLRRVGYRPHRTGLELIAGSPPDLVGQLLCRTQAVAAVSGRRLTVIGHSLGGVLASAVARLRPDLVAHVITLGAPLRDPRGAAHPLVTGLTELLSDDGDSPAAVAATRAWEREVLSTPLPDSVHQTCIYSHEDAVVGWRACIDPDPRSTAHEVYGTHSGLAWNAQVYRLLGQLLHDGAVLSGAHAAE